MRGLVTFLIPERYTPSDPGSDILRFVCLCGMMVFLFVCSEEQQCVLVYP